MDEMDLSALRAIPDPIDRARRARMASREVEQIRNEAVAEAARDGMTQAAIGEALGVTRARISQILKGGPGPGRAFWSADDRVLIAGFGQKQEAPKGTGDSDPALSLADTVAENMLREHLAGLDIEMHREVIVPPGFVDLNRAGLVMVCGPRLSPMIRQMLGADHALGFACDDSGRWCLKDHRAGRTYRSPADSGEDADIAYLGRLPRPDGLGTFIYMAGIHAAGEAGAIHYLTTELDHVWQQVRDHRFSTLIRCSYDRVTREVISSERITDFYRPEGN